MLKTNSDLNTFAKLPHHVRDMRSIKSFKILDSRDVHGCEV